VTLDPFVRWTAKPARLTVESNTTHDLAVGCVFRRRLDAQGRQRRPRAPVPAGPRGMGACDRPAAGGTPGTGVFGSARAPGQNEGPASGGGPPAAPGPDPPRSARVGRPCHNPGRDPREACAHARHVGPVSGGGPAPVFVARRDRFGWSGPARFPYDGGRRTRISSRPGISRPRLLRDAALVTTPAPGYLPQARVFRPSGAESGVLFKCIYFKLQSEGSELRSEGSELQSEGNGAIPGR
jgi:hypothetical protein